MKKLITTNHKLHVARQLQESVSEVANTAYYVFVGEHVPRTDSTIPEIYDKQKDVFIDPYRNMVMGKRVSQNDFALMVRNIPYVSNTHYAHYDDDDNSLYLKDYYVIVDEGSFKHAYICIDNNSNNTSNALSTVRPDFSYVVGSNNTTFSTSDGYRWKYMYSVSSSIAKKFATQEYVPVVANNIVRENAVDGAVDFIKITSSGRGYDNYISGQFSIIDINYLGNTSVYRITNSAFISSTYFYKDCILYLSEGTGSGQYVYVSNSYTNSLGNFIVVNNQFTTTPDATTYYQINPSVSIVSDGTQTINAIARALVNSTASNSIYRIEMLNTGAGYDYYTASVVPPASNSSLVDREAELRTIASPPGGHGFDVAKQLGSTRLCLSVNMEGTEGNNIPIANEFKQIGVLRDPMFSNVSVTFSNSYGTLSSSPSERIYKITPKRFAINAVTSSISANIVCTDAIFESQLTKGDYVYIVSEDNQRHQLTIVENVHNNSVLEISTNCYFSTSNASLFYANISSTAFVANVNAGNVYFQNVSGVISNGDKLIGFDTGALVEVTQVYRNDVAKNFNTFIQLYKYNVNVEVQGFEENEMLYQTNGTATAYVHSIDNDTVSANIYTSNQIGQFVVGQKIVGNTSSAIANVVSIYYPELVFGSGDIMYLENTEAFTRGENQSETFKIIFEF